MFGILWLLATYNMRNYMAEKGGGLLGKWYLFRLGSEYRSVLSKGLIGKKIRNSFEKQGHPLPFDAEIIFVSEDEWIITNGDIKYLIKDIGGELLVEWM